ncbi:MAG: T9SS type A sorting domain-containing protein, partial [Cytophagales bacterium]|nr:T9SS type A sorting domain-containing protein [Cytophagales bacterium]
PGIICTAGVDSVTLTASGAVSYTWAPVAGLSAASGSSVNASPPNDTVYTVVGTGANGCIDSTTVSVQISTTSPVASFSASDTSVCKGNAVTFNNTSTDAISFGWLLPGGTTADTTVQNPVVTYDTVGVFDVTLTAFGCSSFDSTITKAGYITVNPIYSINTPNDTICDGDSVMIFGIFRTTAGTYYDSLPTVNSCDSVISTTLIVNPLPTVNLGADTMICNGCSDTLDAGTGFTSYGWSTGATTQTIIVDTTGIYSVMVTDANGCPGVDTIEVTVTTGIIQSSFINFNLKLYPNPNDGTFLIRYSIPDKQSAEFIIFDVIGSKLKTWQLEGGTKKLNIVNKELKNGLYFYQVIVNNRVILTDKLVIIK